MWWRKAVMVPKVWVVQSDGALAPDGSATGLGVVVREEGGQIVRWIARRVPTLTSNAAEYAALCLALESLAAEPAPILHLYSDSEVMINQMRGRFAVHSQALRSWHQRACQLARHYPLVTYTHIPRGRNQLADALATEALLAALPVPQEH
ncbi:MAG: ribonuclease HI family protein [Ardenticatenales bacterium]|nr:ribonuclease HI family protein [Ardenticatenales bacterium]